MESGREKLAESFGNDWSSGKAKAADLFQDLWKQLGECHQNALQELEAKVSKLKKERCLDAQRLEVFYNRNQQLKEQNKNLQDAITLLEERLRTGECDRCTILEENLKDGQEQNLHLIKKLKNERNLLEDENRKLQAELQKLKMSRFESQEGSPPEQEEGIIPDSPVLPSSLPVVNKLKKAKNTDKTKRVRYAEVPLPLSNNSLFNELNKDPDGATKTPGRAEVLVPNTCEMDSSQISKDVNEDEEEAIAETCGLELIEKHQMKSRKATSQQRSLSTLWKHEVRLKPHCSTPDSTSGKSPSLLPCIRRVAEGGTICSAKWAKEGNDPEGGECSQKGIHEGADNQKEGKHIESEQITQTAVSVSNQCIKKEPQHSKVELEHNESTSQKPSASCTRPAFKKPNRKVKPDADGKRRTPLQQLNASQGQDEAAHAERRHTVEPTWSVDPALALSMYDSEWKKDEEMDEQQHYGEMADTDCTWVSHSLLQRQRENRGDSVSGLGEKANDSLDIMFDTTAYGEYKSCNSSCLGQSQPCDDEEEEDKDPPEDTACQSKARHPAFAHVAVIRKKDERRKLKGTTCKECEIYYAHLPEEERQKKLSSCSRHRYLYIPPCTPEHFWEVGFPSTQTCIERGYIKEDKNPQERLRRRQPFNALFSPKRRKEEN
ncbi:DNA endonuclease RBBP8 isoform X2 [Archocentrus centrarchus]|uniref:DNA endonuclease RBBP8 isoform X2 n=1 Tax=Archocentrus centrarchus TaxID=63155 RepID=UPI0011EA38E4|nr:DNA endonuclease RBBP8-like isoform X2 [Archocentrus centrarchus]